MQYTHSICPTMHTMSAPSISQQIDSEFMQMYLHDTQAEYLFADSRKISGEFFLEGLDIRIDISDSELDDVQAAQKMLIAIKRKKLKLDYSLTEIEDARRILAAFMQAHNHELAHLYQVLALPAFQMVWSTQYNLLRFEAAVMLRHFEQGGHFHGETHRKILQVLKDGHPELVSEFAQQFNNFRNPYEMHISDFRKTYEGISLFYIIESMAHIISLQLSDTPEDDILNLAVAKEYSIAFEHFDSQLSDINVELRWKYLVFLYICYFSCHHFNIAVEHPVNTTVSSFFSLCSKAGFFMEMLAEAHQRYEAHPLEELREMNRWPLSNEELVIANQKKLASIYALFELIDAMEGHAFPDEVPKKTLTVEALSDFFAASDAKGYDWSDKYTLARMLIFPANFFWVRDIYDDAMEKVGTGKEFTYAQEAEFYRFIMNCKNLLQPSYDVLCCEQHGLVNQRKNVLRCRNDDGLASHLKQLTSKAAYDLFRF